MGFSSFLFGALFLFVAQLLRTRYRQHLRSIPGPFVASFSNLWKLGAIYCEDMPEWNIKAHEKFGPVVRIGPNHISLSSRKALQLVYTSRESFSKVSTTLPSGVLPDNDKFSVVARLASTK